MDLVSFVLVAALAAPAPEPAVAAAPSLPALQLFDALPGCAADRTRECPLPPAAGDGLNLAVFDALPGCAADRTADDPLADILRLAPVEPVPDLTVPVQLPRAFSMPNLRPRPTIRAEPIEPAFRVVIASPPWCAVCKTMRAAVGDGNGRVAVDWLVEPVDELPEWARRIAKSHDRWPVIRFECGGQVRYQSGTRTLEQLEQLCGE